MWWTFCKRQWYPVLSVKDTDPERSHAVQVRNLCHQQPMQCEISGPFLADKNIRAGRAKCFTATENSQKTTIPNVMPKLGPFVRDSYWMGSRLYIEQCLNCKCRRRLSYGKSSRSRKYTVHRLNMNSFGGKESGAISLSRYNKAENRTIFNPVTPRPSKLDPMWACIKNRLLGFRDSSELFCFCFAKNSGVHNCSGDFLGGG